MSRRVRINTLWLRLALGLLVITLLVIGVVAVVVWASVEASFRHYVAISDTARFGGDLVGTLEQYHAEHSSWSGAETLLPGRGRGESGGSGTSSDGRGLRVFVADPDGRIVIASQPDWVGKLMSEIGPSRTIALNGPNGVIGTLGEQTPGTVGLTEAERQFTQSITVGLVLTALVGGLVVFGLAIALSYSLTRPLQRLTDYMARWKPRSASTPVPISGTDEVRRLSAAFNDLIARLTAGEAERQRLTADVAHELRTPVTVMRGHLEAIMDGVYPADAAHIGVAYDQALHLGRLVEDLRLLTQAEADRLPLNRANLPLAPAIRQAMDRFEPLAQDNDLRLSATLPDELPVVQADPHRLQQVLDNLLSNALQHTPPGGRIDIEAQQSEGGIWISIYNDTAEPLDDAQIAHLFDRFWRGSASRERDSGGSGLGLTITRELLRLMGGRIEAKRIGEGICFRFMLPSAAE